MAPSTFLNFCVASSYWQIAAVEELAQMQLSEQFTKRVSDWLSMRIQPINSLADAAHEVVTNSQHMPIAMARDGVRLSLLPEAGGSAMRWALITDTPPLRRLFFDDMSDEELLAGFLLVINAFGRTSLQYMALTNHSPDVINNALLDNDTVSAITGEWLEANDPALQEIRLAGRKCMQTIARQPVSDATVQHELAATLAGLSTKARVLVEATPALGVAFDTTRGAYAIQASTWELAFGIPN